MSSLKLQRGCCPLPSLCPLEGRQCPAHTQGFLLLREVYQHTLFGILLPERCIYSPIIIYLSQHLVLSLRRRGGVFDTLGIILYCCVYFVAQIVPTPVIWEHFHLGAPLSCLSFLPLSYLSDMTRCSRFSSYILFSGRRTSHFYKEPWFLSLENCVRNQGLGLGVLVATEACRPIATYCF